MKNTCDNELTLHLNLFGKTNLMLEDPLILSVQCLNVGRYSRHGSAWRGITWLLTRTTRSISVRYAFVDLHRSSTWLSIWTPTQTSFHTLAKWTTATSSSSKDLGSATIAKQSMASHAKAQITSSQLKHILNIWVRCRNKRIKEDKTPLKEKATAEE